MRQPILILSLLVVAGFGAYRAFKYAAGKRRFWGVVPIAFMLFGGVLAPFSFGVMQGAGIGGSELLTLVVVGPLLVAAVAGAVLSLVFRPRQR